MIINILAVFPQFFEKFLELGVVGRAVKNKKVEINVFNLRDFATDKHKTIDDAPYGGGPGMVLKPEPIYRAYEFISQNFGKPFTILTEPWGRKFDQSVALEYSKKKHLLIICGRYEGVDERVKKLVDEEVSIGDYVLSGGEIPAMVIVDCVVRLVPGVLGNEESLKADSFMDRGLLGYPNYTRPAVFRGMKVPEVLLSGNHKAIKRWRLKESFKKTLLRKPETIEKLIAENLLTKEELEILNEAKKELNSAETPPS